MRNTEVNTFWSGIQTTAFQKVLPNNKIFKNKPKAKAETKAKHYINGILKKRKEM